MAFLAIGARAMTLNGQAGGSSANLAHSAERRDLPIGPNIGTLAVLLATILTDGGEWLRVVSKAEACLHEIFRLIGTPSFLDIFGFLPRAGNHQIVVQEQQRRPPSCL